MGACLLPFIGFVPGCYLIKVDRTAVDDDVTDGIKADSGERGPAAFHRSCAGPLLSPVHCPCRL